jgi:protein tyrosine/serine phosphatase
LNVPRFLRRLFAEPYDGLRHFGTVAPGRLYRCGQPRPAELADLITQHGIKTVVALRGSRDANDPDSWETAERAVCVEHGADFVTLPCNHKNPPTAEQVKRFLDLCRDPDATPVLVHCRIGQQRTLLFCGLYRVHVDEVDPDEVEREIDELGFGAHVPRHQRLLHAYRALARTPGL